MRAVENGAGDEAFTRDGFDGAGWLEQAGVAAGDNWCRIIQKALGSCLAFLNTVRSVTCIRVIRFGR